MTASAPPSPCSLLRSALEELRGGLEQLAELQDRLDESLPRNSLPPELLQHYNQQLDRLLEAETLRAKALTSLGLGPNQMNDALGACPDLASLWESIRERLPRVALNNRKHSQVLHKASASIHASLGLLGVLPAQPPLYGPSGQRESTPTGRPLGSA
jgi:flagellar biosynthesis/type III secretory pathway chaperone